MRWLFRPIATLLLAPAVYGLVLYYIQMATSGDPPTWQAALKQAGQTYVAFTLPALALMLVILLPVDLVLRWTGFGLTSVLISPLLAGLGVFILRDVTSEPHIQQWGSALALFMVYGLVWGLTIREPSTDAG